MISSLVNELTKLEDLTLSRDVQIISVDECSLVAMLSEKIVLWNDEDRLPAIRLPRHVYLLCNEVTITWSSSEEREKLSDDLSYEFKEVTESSVGWDDPVIGDDDVRRATSSLDDWQIADDLTEHFGGESNVPYESFPARLRPYLRSCMAAYRDSLKADMK